MKDDIKTWLLVGAVALLCVLVGIQYLGSQRASVNYQADIGRIEAENIRLAELLTDIQGRVGRIGAGLAASTERVSDISIGIGNGIDAFDASIRFTEELLRLIGELEAILGGG